jgi:hypothetical protein
MAASYVGSAGGADGSDFSAFLTFTTTRTIEIGERAVLIIRSVPTPISATVGSLSLTLDATDEFYYWSAQATAQIASGDTVTITFNAETSAGNKNAICDVLGGVDNTTPLRAFQGNNGFGNTPNTGTTDASPLIGDIALGVARSASNVTAAGGGLTLANTTLTNFRSGYEVLASDGADSGTFTLSASDDWNAMITVYRAAPSGAQNQLAWIRA